jgi:hypothetical protein
MTLHLDNLLKVLAQETDVNVGTPQSAEAVERLQKDLGVQLPRSYKDFLQAYGYLSLPNWYVGGLFNGEHPHNFTGCVYCDTQRIRQEKPLSTHLVCIQTDILAPYFLDTSQMHKDGECPLVVVDLRTMRQDDFGGGARTFGTWLANFLSEYAEEIEDEVEEE